MRRAEIDRKTNETDIRLGLELDGSGKRDVDTGCGFLDHMLELFALHGGFDLAVKCKGDTKVDYHHTVEDVGIALGSAFREALGERKGIARYGDCILPMDEALILTAVDVSGRACLGFRLNLPAARVGDFDTELVREFFEGFVRASGITLHVRQLDGLNCHHIIEGVFKSAARSLREAVSVVPGSENTVPSTKGVLV
ncbi:MAG: imidazoleglycerol-phosphate dehydratase HisB [Clostridia bacterium]|nr:imidazoleglycerol-phosphate dehydratase HisB [Clostridia bacterium]